MNSDDVNKTPTGGPEDEGDPTLPVENRSGRGEKSSSTEVNQPADRFTLTQVLGEGAQGEVCKAFDNLLHRHVAIKFPHRADDQVTEDILGEARKAARLNHPNVVTIYEVGFWKGRPFIAMELVEGVSLATILKECGRVSLDRYLRYARQILRALGAAHRSGLIHRDLKPHNVLMAGDGSLKLTDFGVAHVKSGIGKESTVAFKVAGTPAYMAPEQWSGLSPDARSDIYAFGCMSYKLLSGQSVFPSDDPAKHHLSSTPRPLRELTPSVPEPLERVLMRCLAKEPEKRYQSCQEVLQAIDAAIKSGKGAGTAEWPSDSKPVKKQRKVLLPILILVLVALGVFLGVTKPGRKIIDDTLAKLGIGGEDPQPEPDAPGPVDDDTEPDVDERLEFGLGELARAKELARSRDPVDLDEAIRRADSAAEALSGYPEAEEARRIGAEAKKARDSVTESAAVNRFQDLIASARTKLAANDLTGATRDLDEAERLKESVDALRKRGDELNRARLPVAIEIAKDHADRGRFEAAAGAFNEAADLADLLGRGTPRDQHRRDARTCRTLHELNRQGVELPRYAATRYESLSRDLGRFPAGRLGQARVWIAIGDRKRSEDALQALIASGASEEVRGRAQALLDSLP